MDIDPKELAETMLRAAEDAAGDTWETVCDEVGKEIAVLSVNLTTLYQLKVYGDITEAQAKKHFEIQKNAAEAWKHTLKGQVLVDAERTINAALEAVRSFIAETFGWVIFF